MLYELHSRGGLRVVAGGEDCGIKPGMPLAEAAALAEIGVQPLGCGGRLKPELQQSHSPLTTHHSPLLLPHDLAADREALAELAVWCERFSPAVAIEEKVSGTESHSRFVGRLPTSDLVPDTFSSPNGLALDVTGLAPLFGSEAALAERVVREFHERRLAVRVAIADTLGAAWAVAHFEGRGTRDEGRGAEISIVHPGEALRALAPLSVAALRLPEETIELLAAVGVSTIGQLMALPRSALSARFGLELLVHLDWATGEARELLLPHRAMPQIAAEWNFETPIDSLEVIEQVLEELIRRVSAVLAKRDEGALGLVCRIACGDGQRPLWPVSRPSHTASTEGLRARRTGRLAPLRSAALASATPHCTDPATIGRIALAVGLFRPSASSKHLWELLKLKLQTLRLEAPVASLAIEVTSTAALSREQQELFTPDRSREAPRHLSALVERLSSRLGREAVVRPVLMPDAQPEFASVDWPWTGEGKGTRGEGRGTSVGVSALAGRRERPPLRPRTRVRALTRRASLKAELQPGVRPIWLAETPLPLSVISVVPAGPPAQFHLDGIDYRVAQTWGPERIETGWWRTAGARRDYYRVETTSGRRFWLFRRLADARWFLHGEFG